MISVITISNRPRNLIAAANQVRSQIVGDELEHVMVLDGVELNSELRREIEDHACSLVLVNAPPEPQRFIFEKFAALKNTGIHHASGQFIAFLDDDNEWLDNHLAILQDALWQHTAADFSYSWRSLLNADGSPHNVDGLYPWGWGCDITRRQALFRIQKEVGILEEGSNLAKDKYGFEFKGERFSCVDSGEFMFRRELLARISFKEEFSYTELLYGFCDDYLMGVTLLKAGATGVCTEQPTLRYYLGGNSQEDVHGN